MIYGEGNSTTLKKGALKIISFLIPIRKFKNFTILRTSHNLNKKYDELIIN